MRQRLFTLFNAFLLTFFISPLPAYASRNFTTDYHIVYTPAENGITHAQVNVIMTNTTTEFYATSYRMQLGFDTITNVKASDPEGPVDPIIQKTKDGYQIDLKFNKKAVGLNKKLPFTVSFDTPSISKNYGLIREINVSGLANPEEFSSFSIEIKPPSSFGKAAYSKPEQKSNTLLFTKQQLGKSGISIAFGEKQIYLFHLTYHLHNPNLYPTKITMALPPSTNYQNVFISNINPVPDNVYEDRDGNWIAEYSLKSAQKLDAVVIGKAELRLNPEKTYMSQQDLAPYLTADTYWETQNPRIQKLANELKTPEKIYNYVVQTLTYDFSRVAENKDRLGAVGALNNKNSAACREFTDFFIALARAAGIPAREINGFAYTENTRQRPLSLVKDILHSWPEYYDKEKQTWIMVDPTWGSTTGGIDYFSTLDFDHLAFVIKGSHSTSPISAGDYKIGDGSGTKDVLVAFTDSIQDSKPEFEITTDMPTTIPAGFPIKGKIILKNNGGAFIPKQIVYVSSDTLLPNVQTLANPGIPPFGKAVLDVEFKPTNLLTNTQAQFTIRVAGQTENAKVTIAPFFLTPIGGGSILGIFAIIILIITLKSRGLHLSKRR